MTLKLLPLVVLMHVWLYALTTHGAIQPLSSSNRRYLIRVYNMFREEFQHDRQCHRSREFAVMTLGRLQANELYPPPPPYFPSGYADLTRYNYFAAVPSGSQRHKVHAEEHLISAFNNMVPAYYEQDARRVRPRDVYIYTYYSPCLQCALSLQQLASDNDDINFHIGYNESYSDIDWAQEHMEGPNIFFGQLGGSCDPNQREDLKRKRSSSDCQTIFCERTW